MPVRGSTVLASADTRTPPVPDIVVLPAWFKIPEEGGPFAPKELAGYLRVSPETVIGWIDAGELLAFPVHIGKRTTWRIPYLAVEVLFRRRARAVSGQDGARRTDGHERVDHPRTF